LQGKVAVVMNFLHNQAAADEALAVVGSAGVLMRFDVADAEAVNQAFPQIVADHGGIHILVNNAGVAVNALTLGAKDADWQRALAVNLGGAFNCTRAALRSLMHAQGGGRIINIASVVGETGSAGQGPYAAAKAGLLGLTKTWAREYASRGVTVNAVSPGFIETDMTAAGLSPERRADVLKSIPMGRVGTPEDVAAAVVYLAGSGAGYVTGQVLRVNGGLLM
jgi:3-oxoacyl-[acyl-carrier protein] reductase